MSYKFTFNFYVKNNTIFVCLDNKHNAWIKHSSIHFINNISYGTDPVKLIPDKCGDAVIVSPNTGPSAGIKLTTPGGTPASVMIS